MRNSLTPGQVLTVAAQTLIAVREPKLMFDHARFCIVARYVRELAHLLALTVRGHCDLPVQGAGLHRVVCRPPQKHCVGHDGQRAKRLEEGASAGLS